MRRIWAGEFMTLDGVLESPDQWSTPYFNDEVGSIIGANMASSDAMLLGRVTYQEWQGYWPDKSADDDPFAAFINNARKYVVSTTLDSVDEAWGAELLRGDFREAITALKESEGGDIIVNGCISVLTSLIRERLLDRLDLLVSPVVVGKGRHLFEGGAESAGLELVDSKTLTNGVISVSYRLADA
ncbi:MAG TPA: dihydrofolate reductase family protein [Actinomycetota bacterium]|nr:dihydrofolate reductase family protein [Actinomycetota bacterium]